LAPLFEIQEASFSYEGGIPGITGASLAVNAGERVAILGANGSGKSTLLKMMAGLVFPQQGRVCAFGRELSEKAFQDPSFRALFRKQVGMLFQNVEVQLFSSAVSEEIAFGPRQLGLKREEIELRINDLLGMLRIEPLRERSPSRLSLGEKRKVAIASVLAVNPDVLLLDEPTSGLDPRSRREFLEFLQALHRAGKTLVTATHDLDIVPDLADRAYVLSEERKLVASGDIGEILGDTSRLRAWNLM
jgi:cobalt/nickel transport system ATP-binding protein